MHNAPFWSQEQFVKTVTVQRQFYDLHLRCLIFKLEVCNLNAFPCLQANLNCSDNIDKPLTFS